MMDDFEMAKALVGKKTTEGTTEKQKKTVQVFGVATSDSAGGKVMVDMGGPALTADDTQSIEMDTNVAVKEGDTVSILLTGADGTAKSPLVIGAIGRGDEQAEEITAAQSSADEAQKAADAAQETAATANANASNAQSTADSAQSKVNSVSDDISNLNDKLYDSSDGDITNILSTLSSYQSYVHIDPSIPALILGRNTTGTRVQLTDTELQFWLKAAKLAYLSNERLNAPTAEVTSLFFGMKDTSGNQIGKLGWVQRANGHLTLMKLR